MDFLRRVICHCKHRVCFYLRAKEMLWRYDDAQKGNSQLQKPRRRVTKQARNDVDADGWQPGRLQIARTFHSRRAAKNQPKKPVEGKNKHTKTKVWRSRSAPWKAHPGAIEAARGGNLLGKNPTTWERKRRENVRKVGKKNNRVQRVRPGFPEVGQGTKRGSKTSLTNSNLQRQLCWEWVTNPQVNVNKLTLKMLMTQWSPALRMFFLCVCVWVCSSGVLPLPPAIRVGPVGKSKLSISVC